MSPEVDFDLAILGGGPAGLATAIAARRRGLRCIVLERRDASMDKACGEGLMPPGVRSLREMEVEIEEGAQTPIEGIRYVDGDTVAEGRFSKPGLGVRRVALMKGMLERASALGAELCYRSGRSDWEQRDDRVVLRSGRGSLHARYLVAADGLRSSVRRSLALERREGGRRRCGLRRHYGGKGWSNTVEVHWAEGVEAYVTPVGGEVGVAMLYPGDRRRFETLLDLFPSLRAQLAGREWSSSPRGAGPFRQRVHRRFRGRVALVGDAAGYLDALTGEGLTLAFDSALALVDTIAAGEPLSAYETRYRRLSQTYYRMTGLMLHIARRPALRRRVIRMLASRPELFDRMLALNTGELPLHRVGAANAARMLLGIVRSGSAV